MWLAKGGFDSEINGAGQIARAINTVGPTSSPTVATYAFYLAVVYFKSYKYLMRHLRINIIKRLQLNVSRIVQLIGLKSLKLMLLRDATLFLKSKQNYK